MSFRSRILNILIAADQFVYVLVTLGKGMPDETISAAAYRGEMLGHPIPKLARPVIDALFWFDPQHCAKAYRAEVIREQSP
jgi:hypothetical protein